MSKTSRRIWIPIAVILPFVVIALIVYLLLFNTTYVTAVKVDGNVVDNSYNNAVANEMNDQWSRLARIDNRLYYSYAPTGDMFKYGTYEISDNFTKRIYWDGVALTASILNLNTVGDDEILLNKGDGRLNSFDIDGGEYKSFTQLDESEVSGKNHLEAFYVDGKQYWYSGDETKGIISAYEIYSCDNGKLNLYFSTKEINNGGFTAPCFSEDYVYLAQINDDDDAENRLFKYSVKEKKVVAQANVGDAYGNYGIVSNDKCYSIVYSDDECRKLFVTDVNENKQMQLLDTTGGAIVNGYGSLVCVGVYSDSAKNGLYVIDVETDELKKIYSGGEVCGIYIVDDKWIYFIDSTDKLYRITPDGKDFQKVFG